MTIAISCGEPAGIGPEVAYRAWEALCDKQSLLWIGDPRHLPEEARWKAVSHPNEAALICAQALPVLPLDIGPPPNPGSPESRHATGVIRAIEIGVSMAQSGDIAALTTAPINKQALAEGAAFTFPGHTEFLAHLAGDVDVAMMLAGPDLRVVPATIHIPLSEVPRALTETVLERTIRITDTALRRDFGLAMPRIAVAGLNPHAGENGRMGREEITMITPLIHRLRTEGLDLLGPLPADTMFHPSARARFDAAVCAYHDQALVPLKTLAFDEGVNITLGLPFIRTSPDHGTAFDIAGTGTANPASMIAAIDMAATLAKART